jgi:predicted DNA-binding transcriptional regulator YafY
MNYLIRSKRTGTPIQFAEKLEISESTLYQHLNDLRELGAPIAYDKFRQTYYY